MNVTILTWAQVIATVIIAGTFVVYFLQLRTMRKASDSQNLLLLIGYLNTPEIHSARKHVLSNLKPGGEDSWSEEDKAAASRVCASYDTAGILIQRKVVDGSLILENWGPSIARCYEIAAPFIIKLRAGMGPKYWDDFEWLYRQVKKEAR